MTTGPAGVLTKNPVPSALSPLSSTTARAWSSVSAAAGASVAPTGGTGATGFGNAGAPGAETRPRGSAKVGMAMPMPMDPGSTLTPGVPCTHLHRVGPVHERGIVGRHSRLGGVPDWTDHFSPLEPLLPVRVFSNGVGAGAGEGVVEPGVPCGTPW